MHCEKYLTMYCALGEFGSFRLWLLIVRRINETRINIGHVHALCVLR